MIVINILVVCALPYSRNTMCSVVKNAGFRVIGTAKDGQEACILYNELKPDIVLMDIALPKLNGVEVLKKIIKSDCQARVLLFSDINQQSLVDKIYKEGAKDFIVKPFTAQRVVSGIKKVLEID